MVVSSTSTPGSGIDSEPVAMTMLRARYSVPSTETLPGAVITPVPLSHVTLFFLNRNSTPLVFAPTTSDLRACMRAMSSFTSPTITP